MTELTSTVFRIVKIGSKRFVLGLHPMATEDAISIRPLGKRTGYLLMVSTAHIHAAFNYGRAEQAAKRQARKDGRPWRFAKRSFQSSVIPPTIKSRTKKAIA